MLDRWMDRWTDGQMDRWICDVAVVGAGAVAGFGVVGAVCDGMGPMGSERDLLVPT